MKINISTWIINIIGALAFGGIAVLGVNSPALPKTSVAYLVVLGAVMTLVALGNAFKASVVPAVNAEAVLKHAESVPPTSPKAIAAVEAAKDSVK